MLIPHVTLTADMMRESHVYALLSAIRGLCDLEIINLSGLLNLSQFVYAFSYTEIKDVVSTADYLNSLSTVKHLERVDILRRKILGLQGEMAFHIARGADYHTAFKVAESYFIHGLNVEWEDYPLTVPEDLLYIYPDACLNPAEDVAGFCGDSLKVNVKTRPREANTDNEGLQVDVVKDPLYVASSKRSRIDIYETLPCTYAILGYALKSDVLSAPYRGRFKFIQRFKLHPFRNFNVKDYLNPVKVRDLM